MNEVESKVDRARTLLGEARKLQRAGHADGALSKVWSAVDWLCDAIEASERRGTPVKPPEFNGSPFGDSQR